MLQPSEDGRLQRALRLLVRGRSLTESRLLATFSPPPVEKPGYPCLSVVFLYLEELARLRHHPTKPQLSQGFHLSEFTS